MTVHVTKKSLFIAAMSGGVDSSVAAALMIKEGYKIIGVTLQLFDCDNATELKKSCCSSEDKRQIIKVCELLGISHYFLDMRNLFERKVLFPSWLAYSEGRTPNPCVLCNREIKFRALLDYAHSIGAEGIITGHYAKIATLPDGEIILSRGVDSNKDQSYFLSLVVKEDLRRSLMPLGDKTKQEVRALAREFGLQNAEKVESQDACFGMLGANFAETLRRKFKGAAREGTFVDTSGRVLGKHQGIHNFTIGQRRGFGKSFGKPMFVKNIDRISGEVVLSSEEKDLFSSRMTVIDVNWLRDEFKGKKYFDALVQIRYRSCAALAKVFQGENCLKVEFYEPQRAITPGQVAVFYDKDSVIAGGIIQEPSF